MIDKTIPYYNFIMKLEKINDSSLKTLPSGFKFKMFEEGDEIHWAEIEYAIGDFDSYLAALTYFKEKYLKDIDLLRKRCIFIIDDKNNYLATCTAWFDWKDEKIISSLHWLATLPNYQNLGLGRAVLSKTLEIYQENNLLPIYLHTQPWSYKAIKLYLSVGFKPLKEDSFNQYQNQYLQAIATLKSLYDQDTYQYLIKNTIT